jgi:hypothetical protein
MNKSFQRIEELFSGALDLPDVDRQKAFLDQNCAGDARLRAEVERLLSLREAAEHFLARAEAWLEPARPGAAGIEH